MNPQALIDYLKDKKQNKNINEFEKTALTALSDKKFITESRELVFLKNINYAQQILTTPASYDTVNNRHQYDWVINNIGNTYLSMKLGSKAKITSLAGQVNTLNTELDGANQSIKHINDVAKELAGSTVLVAYAKEFKARADQYGEKAGLWSKRLMVSIAIFTVVVVLMLVFSFFDISFLDEMVSQEILFFGYASAIFVKVVIITASIQVIRFINKNYNANKHLEIQSLHKYDVLRSLHAVYKTIPDDQTDVKSELIKTGALTAFQPFESGFITTKEGAGSDVGMLALISNLVKR